MRSLWRIMAASWLSGEGSAALLEESSPFDFIGSDLWGGARKSVFAELCSGVSLGAMLIAREGAARFFALRGLAETVLGLEPLPIAL